MGITEPGLLVGYEKSLKGFLLFNGKKIQKLHNIEELSKEIIGLVPELATLLEQASELTPYAVQFRYPGASENEVIDDEDISRALAEKIVGELSGRLPFEAAWDI